MDGSDNVNVTGGLSNTIIMTTSFVGFITLFAAIAIIFLRSPANAPDNDGEDGHANNGHQRTYGDELEEADVSTLNRAQRRALAKHRMKKMRRIEPIVHDNAVDGAANEEGNHRLLGDGNIGNANGDVHDGNDDTNINNNNFNQASRKERHKAAKAKERDERKQYEEERKKVVANADEKARETRRERERDKNRQKIEDEARRKESLEIEYNRWRYMFHDESQTTGGEGKYVGMTNELGTANESSQMTTVREFVSHLHEVRVISLYRTAAQFSIGTKALTNRLLQLEKEGRIPGGVFDDSGNYIYFSEDDLGELSRFIQCQRLQSEQDDQQYRAKQGDQEGQREQQTQIGTPMQNHARKNRNCAAISTHDLAKECNRIVQSNLHLHTTTNSNPS